MEVVATNFTCWYPPRHRLTVDHCRHCRSSLVFGPNSSQPWPLLLPWPPRHLHHRKVCRTRWSASLGVPPIVRTCLGFHYRWGSTFWAWSVTSGNHQRTHSCVCWCPSAFQFWSLLQLEVSSLPVTCRNSSVIEPNLPTRVDRGSPDQPNLDVYFVLYHGLTILDHLCIIYDWIWMVRGIFSTPRLLHTYILLNWHVCSMFILFLFTMYFIV